MPQHLIRQICDEIDSLTKDEPVRTRQGSTFAVRNALERLPAARLIATSEAVRSHAAEHLPGGEQPHVVRAILFDKNSSANWKVPWHQDVTICVKERIETPGFGPWSTKAGVPHVQPPADVLARMITLRIALDDCDESNGPLLVLPGTHANGVLDRASIERAKAATQPVACTCRAGDAVLIRPLALHASSAAEVPHRRRILHLEFAASPLPGRLCWRTV